MGHLPRRPFHPRADAEGVRTPPLPWSHQSPSHGISHSSASRGQQSFVSTLIKVLPASWLLPGSYRVNLHDSGLSQARSLNMDACSCLLEASWERQYQGVASISLSVLGSRRPDMYSFAISSTASTLGACSSATFAIRKAENVPTGVFRRDRLWRTRSRTRSRRHVCVLGHETARTRRECCRRSRNWEVS